MNGQKTIRDVEEKLRKLAEDQGIELENIIIFGSRVREDYRDSSDIDVVLVSSDFEGVNWYKRPKNFFLGWDYDSLPTPELLCYTPEEFEEKKEKAGSIVKTASEEGVSLA